MNTLIGLSYPPHSPRSPRNGYLSERARRKLAGLKPKSIVGMDAASAEGTFLIDVGGDLNGGRYPALTKATLITTNNF
jgi:hypothetical protein